VGLAGKDWPTTLPTLIPSIKEEIIDFLSSDDKSVHLRIFIDEKLADLSRILYEGLFNEGDVANVFGMQAPPEAFFEGLEEGLARDFKS
jgi:hypothetical protein